MIRYVIETDIDQPEQPDEVAVGQPSVRVEERGGRTGADRKSGEEDEQDEGVASFLEEPIQEKVVQGRNS